MLRKGGRFESNYLLDQQQTTFPSAHKLKPIYVNMVRLNWIGKSLLLDPKEFLPFHAFSRCLAQRKSTGKRRHWRACYIHIRASIHLLHTNKIEFMREFVVTSTRRTQQLGLNSLIRILR